MKQFIIPVVACSLLLSVVACNGSKGESTPAPTPQIVQNGTYQGTVITPPTSLSMVVTGLSAAITLTSAEGSIIINGTFNANVATSSSSVASTTCYNGVFADGYALTITNCLYLSATKTFSGNLVVAEAPIPVTLVAS